LELGLTPSDVFGLWTNINVTLSVLAEAHLKDTPQKEAFSALTAQRHSGKEPKDVLARVSMFRDQLAVLTVNNPSIEGDDVLTKELIFLFRGEDVTVTPSLVYLRSGHILEEVATIASQRAPKSKSIGNYFRGHQFKNKTPSDVFGLVDLAHRRLKLLISSKAQATR